MRESVFQKLNYKNIIQKDSKDLNSRRKRLKDGANESKFSFGKIAFFVLFSVFLLILGRNLWFLPQIDLRSEVQKNSDLKDKVSDFVSKQKATFSVYYKDTKTGEEFGINENRVLTGASLNKIYIVAYLYKLASEGKINLEDKVVVQQSDIQDYGTGTIRYQGDNQTYSLKTLAQLSLENSDNTAAYLLGVRLGMDNIQNYVKNLGLSATDMQNNKTTAKDVGKMLELIYTKKVANPSLTAELLDFLKDTDFEDRLPRYLTKNNISVYHKTGDATNMLHDAGIIDDKTNPFILSVMTSDVENEEETKDAIGKVAKIIYDQRF